MGLGASGFRTDFRSRVLSVRSSDRLLLSISLHRSDCPRFIERKEDRVGISRGVDERGASLDRRLARLRFRKSAGAVWRGRVDRREHGLRHAPDKNAQPVRLGSPVTRTRTSTLGSTRSTFRPIQASMPSRWKTGIGSAFLIWMTPRDSVLNFGARSLRVLSVSWMRQGWPCDSMRLAKLTVPPQRS